MSFAYYLEKKNLKYSEKYLFKIENSIFYQRFKKIKIKIILG